MELLLVVGHKSDKPGAYNETYDTYEFDFNKTLANDISSSLCWRGINHDIKYRNRYKDLPFEINALKPKYIISLHCNAFNSKASGTEMLYYINSIRSEAMAKIFQKNIVRALSLPNRGVKGKSTEERGAYLLRYTNAQCIICESFFIDNFNDFEKVKEKYKRLVAMYIRSIYDVRENLIK